MDDRDSRSSTRRRAKVSIIFVRNIMLVFTTGKFFFSLLMDSVRNQWININYRHTHLQVDMSSRLVVFVFRVQKVGERVRSHTI